MVTATPDHFKPIYKLAKDIEPMESFERTPYGEFYVTHLGSIANPDVFVVIKGDDSCHAILIDIGMQGHYYKFDGYLTFHEIERKIIDAWISKKPSNGGFLITDFETLKKGLQTLIALSNPYLS